MSSSDWLTEAAALPIAFAQVREDPWLDRELLAMVRPAARVVMVASGGCTAAYLATAGPAHLHLVDPNPAQLALARLKLHLLTMAPPAERLAVLGHAPLALDKRRRQLQAALDKLGLAHDIFGHLERVAEWGPDYAGRYERLFLRLRQRIGMRDDMHRLLRLTDPHVQARLVIPTAPLGRALDAAYDVVLALPNLVELFGDGATHNPAEPFARHFARRTRHVLATMPAADNPYLWSMLAGQLPDAVKLPWLEADAPSRLPSLAFAQAMMSQVLEAHREEFDFVHLSNILDWLSPAEGLHTLELAWRALRRGGVVLIRQLNSSLDIPGLGSAFEWDRELGEQLLSRDRSFFYRALHLGRKP